MTTTDKTTTTSTARIRRSSDRHSYNISPINNPTSDMAADLIMPVLPGNQHSQHFFPQRPHHTRAQSYQIPQGTHQISPLTPSGSPDSTSNPTSPKAHHARQPRPLYMPAALRPNLFPSKKSKGKPAEIVTALGNETDGTLRRTNSSIMSLPGMALFGNKLTRTSTGDSGRSSLEGDFDLELFPEVTSLPTRMHWKVSLNSKHLHIVPCACLKPS